ncbi:Uncharacterised protein [uncultured Clostridium sp.]|nr:Uncharacterised protein [uncultured Clostridium sp.]
MRFPFNTEIHKKGIDFSINTFFDHKFFYNESNKLIVFIVLKKYIGSNIMKL